MHGLWLDDFLIEDLQANYPIENVDYEVIGELLDDELDKIISCFKNSSTVKRKYKKILSQ